MPGQKKHLLTRISVLPRLAPMHVRRALLISLAPIVALAAGLTVWSQAPTPRGPFETKPSDPYFAKFNPIKAPEPSGLLLESGDRLAICGDSITEQRMYSRVIETYLTVCVPELSVAVRQYGWGGETATGFLARMTNDCLRFGPTVATTCYGMNDHGYQAYTPQVGQRYGDALTAIARSFKSAGVRVVLGSPGCVGHKLPWSKASSEDMNLSLCTLRDIAIKVAAKEGTAFADVFWPMLTAGFEARRRYGDDYFIAGEDGVHPDWAGGFVMARSFLKAMDLAGQIGSINVDLVKERVSVSAGHELHGLSNGELIITSHRYPFCATGDLNRDNSIRSAMSLVPFNAELNRFVLVVTGTSARNYKVTWGETTRSYTADQLARGINLADDFILNPFSEPFKKVDEAVAAKQAYETHQVKTLFHGEEGRVDMDMTTELSEKVRDRLVQRIESAFVPVTHSIRIRPE